MTVYLCPRSDLDCAERFLSTGDLDYHLHVTHGYRAFWRIVASLRPDHPLPIGPRPARHVPDGLAETPGTPTLVASPGTPTLGESHGTAVPGEPAPTPQLERAPAPGARTAARRGARARTRGDIRTRSRAGARTEKAGRADARNRTAEPSRRRRRLRISR
ncbi:MULTISPECIES: hypothetical protein [Frankia]|uniref:Uncharacterized protein n=1 Tax=Frankia alni (strain DSM 45986 / CECT 9034 / ACN14a) TaxID=326424 RepID=Q0RLY5_FRAAA|nr:MULTISPECIES: hypothetical protein [Frankia]CAJ61468.1 hypothetical protein FRAAL2824 [Frankia alni ACN14a]